MMPDTVTLQSLSRVQDGQGGLTEQWSNSYLAIPARLSELTAAEVMAASQEGVRADYMMTVPWDQNITPTMRVHHRGVVYEVVSVNTAQSINTARRCLIRRV